jgi:hypothetical protein
MSAPPPKRQKTSETTHVWLSYHWIFGKLVSVLGELQKTKEGLVDQTWLFLPSFNPNHLSRVLVGLYLKSTNCYCICCRILPLEYRMPLEVPITRTRLKSPTR